MKITGTDKLAKLSARVRDVPKAGERALFRAINTTAAKVQTMAVRSITSQLALQSSYVRGLLRIAKASPGRLEAIVAARRRPVRLARFGARQLTRAAKRARGDASRGISPGRKASGVSVKVTKAGGTKRMPKAFLLPLRAGELGQRLQTRQQQQVVEQVLHAIGLTLHLLHGTQPARAELFGMVEQGFQVAGNHRQRST